MLLLLLVAVAIGLSGCYMDPDPIVDNQNGLNLGTGGQQFDTVVTPTPAATTVPSPTPTADTSQIEWDQWNFQGDDTATQPPSNVIPVGPTPAPGSTTAPVATGTAPQSTISGEASTTTLRSGSSGSSVSQLQQRLKELGYYQGTVDGQYGTGTVNAVKAFQQNNNLRADGVAGPATQTAVYGFSAVRASSTGGSPSGSTTTTTTTRATATPRPTTRPSSSGRTDIYLRLGDSGSNVKTMQTWLISLGYLSGTADGKFEETTEAAVKAFQKRNSLYDDGVAGPNTLVKLYSNSAKRASSTAAHIGALRRGMNGDAVRTLQQQLKNRGFYNGSIDGDYGAGTEAAVMAFQSANGLTADGVAGTATMNALYAGTGGSGTGTGTGTGTGVSGIGADDNADFSEDGATANSDVLLYWTPGVESLDASLRMRVQFALDNGFAGPVYNAATTDFPAGRNVTRAEMAAFLYMMLETIGGL